MSSNKAAHSPKPESRPRVVVLGGGFAGIGAARKLRKAEADVVVIDGHDYHTFQPLLYQVATDLLPHGTVGRRGTATTSRSALSSRPSTSIISKYPQRRRDP